MEAAFLNGCEKMNDKKKLVSAVIVAAGLGKRMKAQINKQYLLLKDKPILAYTIEKFENNDLVDEIIIVTKQDEKLYCKENVVDLYGFKKVKAIVTGGAERQDSVYSGLKSCDSETDIVLIHDGVRPFIKTKEIDDIITQTIKTSACVTGVRVKDTIKVVDNENNIIDTPNRENLWLVHTPQSFSYKLILDGHERCKREKWTVTDDSMLIEKLGIKVKMIEGSYDNIKITTPGDLIIAEGILDKNDL